MRFEKNCTVLKFHDKCHYPKCKCQKQITFTHTQFQVEGGSIKSRLKPVFGGTQSTRNKILEPAVNEAALFIGMAVSGKFRNRKVGQATTIILKSLSGGGVLN